MSNGGESPERYVALLKGIQNEALVPSPKEDSSEISPCMSSTNCHCQYMSTTTHSNATHVFADGQTKTGSTKAPGRARIGL